MSLNEQQIYSTFTWRKTGHV